MKSIFLIKIITLLIWTGFITGCSSLGIIVTGQPGSNPSEREPAVVHPPQDGYPSYHKLHIPKGHLPPPGKCRIWEPGAPPGLQKPPMDCDQAFRLAPMGFWVIERPSHDERLLHVHHLHANRPGVVINLDIYSLSD